MGIGKDQLVFDATDGGDVVAAFLKASDGTLITHTGGALNVNVANASIAVTATNLDIRDLAHTQDSVRIGDGTDLANVTAAGELNVIESNLTDLKKAEDSAHVSGDFGMMPLGVRSDAGGSLVSADGDYSPLSIDASGNLRVAASITINAEKAEDAAHASGDTGSYVLSVREDSPSSSTSASGDYQSVKTDVWGRMWVNNSSQSFAHAAVSVTNTATDLVASDLAGRKSVIVYNNGTKTIFVGNSGVTASSGIPVSGGSSIELAAGPAMDLYAITASGSSDVRVLELA